MLSSEYFEFSEIELLIPDWVFSTIYISTNWGNFKNVSLNELVLSGRNVNSLCYSLQRGELNTPKVISKHVASFHVMIMLEKKLKSVERTMSNSNINI